MAVEVVCQGCGESFEGKRRTAKYCGDTCRKRGGRRGGAPAAVAAIGEGSGLVAAIRAELETADRVESSLGQQALALAAQIGAPGFQTGSAVAALSRELRAVMAEVLADAPRVGDALDELAARRAEKAAGA